MGFALKFTNPGVLIVPIDIQSEKPDGVILEAVDATLTLDKIRTTRKLISYFTVLLFVLAAVLAFLHVDRSIMLALVLGLNAVMLAIQYVFEWAQRVQCEVLTKRLRSERLLKDHLI